MPNEGKSSKEEFALNEDASDSEILSAFLLKFYDKATRTMKKWFKLAMIGLAALVGLSVCFIAIGINMEWNELVSFGAILKAIASLVGLLLLAPIIIALESIGKGKVSGQGFVKFLGTCFLLQMLIALVIFNSPMSVNMVTLFSLTFAVCLFSFAMTIGNIPAVAITSILLLVSGMTLFFPKYRDMADNWVRGVNAPELLQLSPGDIPKHRVQFYLNGKPIVKYFIIRSHQYELFKSAGSPYHDLYQGKLKPITDEIIFKLERNESLISPRNFVGSSTSAATPSAGSYATSPPPAAVPEPPPAPAPYVPSPPENSSRINLSKPWKYRYEVIPGYQKYKERAFSGWASVRIERWDSEVKVVTLAPDGREIGDFNGTQTGPDTYKGSWSMRDGSGRGEFYCRRENPDRITGSMNDETVDPRFLPMELCTRQNDRTEIQTQDRRKIARPRYDSDSNARKKRELARVPYPAPSEPRRAVAPRPAPTFAPESEPDYKNAAIERQPTEHTARPQPQFRQAPAVSAVPRPKPIAIVKPTPIESDLETGPEPAPKKSKEEEEEYRRIDRMAWPNSQ